MKFLKNNFKLIIGFIIGIILASGVVYAVTSANQVSYTTEKNEKIETVADALNELYLYKKKEITLTGNSYTSRDFSCGICGINNVKKITIKNITYEGTSFVIGWKKIGNENQSSFSSISIGDSFEINNELLIWLNNNVDCVEFHCTSDDEIRILKNWKQIKSNYRGQLSICINRSKLGDEKIIKLLKQMVFETKNVIIQADGNPISGGSNDYKSNLQTLAFAELIRNSGINSILILSGGTNEKTLEFAKLCNIDINGVAIGSYARKLVNEYVKRDDFWFNKDVQINAVSKAKKLLDKLR